MPTVKSYLLFPVMNLLFTEIDPAIFLQIAACSTGSVPAALDPDVDSVDLVPRKLGLTKVRGSDPLR